MREVRSDEELDAALRLRERVFVGEQGVTPEADRDGLDPSSVHVVALAGGELVGTCRLLAGRDGSARLGRMAVERGRRRQGIGAALLDECERLARADASPRIVLNAQLEAEPLYAGAGYHRVGGEFVEEGIAHVRMEKRLA